MLFIRFIFLVSCGLLCFHAQAESTRINVYTLAENFYDSRTGDTLSGISQQLLPNNPSLQKQLADDILQLNPDAFIDNNPASLLANKRLQLPVYMPASDTKADTSKIKVESFSWGNIKRPLD